MTLDKTVVTDAGNHWLIERNFEFQPMGMFKKQDKEVPTIFVTPGIAPDRTPDVRPRRIEYGKDLGDIDHVLSSTVPAIIDKEKECPICKDAKTRVDAMLAGDAQPEELVEDSNPEQVGFLRSLLRTTAEALPRPSDIFPTFKELRPDLRPKL